MSSKLFFVLATSALISLRSELIAGESTLTFDLNEQVSSSAEETREFRGPFTGKITGAKVRVRTQPTVESPIVRETNQGEIIAVLGMDNDFYAVKPSKGTKGYVFRTFILDGVVEGERVNVRLYPDTDAPIIGRLQNGEKVDAVLSAINPKWLEIDLPENSKFYIAKDYIENIGPVQLYAKLEERQYEANHLLNSALSFSRSEIQKPFEEIDVDQIHLRLQKLMTDYADLAEVASKAKEVDSSIHETYIQKKIAFLESRADRATASLGVERSALSSIDAQAIGSASANVIGLSTIPTEKMALWQPLEESVYHLWAVANEGKSMEDFYQQESENGMILTGIVEPYTRPVKNRPGDFLLRSETLPVAFLYSTKVDLQELVGRKVTLIGAERPNNNFAFKAFFVLSIE